ncbi:MAG: hypothetical protein MZV70_14210 [Desulfobacterales bacterium]|nr:hypothetical protein [Desulfobacterales bacterium]
MALKVRVTAVVVVEAAPELIFTLPVGGVVSAGTGIYALLFCGFNRFIIGRIVGGHSHIIGAPSLHIWDIIACGSNNGNRSAISI